jgi:hypothetical protein
VRSSFPRDPRQVPRIHLSDLECRSAVIECPGAEGEPVGSDEEVHVIEQIATESGQSYEVVERVVAAIHDAVDYWLADDYVVVLAPFTLAYGDSPTRRALVSTESDPPHDALHGDHLAIAEWLGLDFDDYVLNPVANRIGLVAAVADRLDSADEEIDGLWAVLEAWESTYEDPTRVYRVGPSGREAKLEEWLVEHVAALRDHGFHLIISHRQHVLPSRRRPDLIARVLSDSDQYRIGDWLVLELKATRAYPDALRQLDDYVTEVREHIATGDERVHGLLVADGMNHADHDLRRDLDIAFLSLAQIGYREHLIEHRGASPMVQSEPPLACRHGRPAPPTSRLRTGGPTSSRWPRHSGTRLNASPSPRHCGRCESNGGMVTRRAGEPWRSGPRSTRRQWSTCSGLRGPSRLRSASAADGTSWRVAMSSCMPKRRSTPSPIRTRPSWNEARTRHHHAPPVAWLPGSTRHDETPTGPRGGSRGASRGGQTTTTRPLPIDGLRWDLVTLAAGMTRGAGERLRRSEPGADRPT